MRQIIQRLLNLLGYEIRRLGVGPHLDLELYSSLYPEDSLTNKRFYNIGAGGFSHPYWTNVDYDSEWYAANRSKTTGGIQHDLFSLEPLPIETSTAEVVYSSHTVEHVNDEAAQNMFNEAHRILKPNGVFRLTTPNIDLEYRAYRHNDRDYFYWIGGYSVAKNWEKVKYNKPLNEASTGQIFLVHFAASVSILHSDGAKERIHDEELRKIFDEMDYEDALNYCTSRCPIEIQRKYPGLHLNWWNWNKACRMLKAAGFNEIYLSGYGQSFCPVLRNTALFDNTHPKISLYVEAVR